MILVTGAIQFASDYAEVFTGTIPQPRDRQS